MVYRKPAPSPEQDAALKAVRAAADALERAKADRDEAIRQATTHGVTRRVVAAAAGLSYARVQQIVAAEPSTDVAHD